MIKPGTLAEAMRYCSAASNCEECPAYRYQGKDQCARFHAEAADLIDQQEKTIAELRRQLHAAQTKSPK